MSKYDDMKEFYEKLVERSRDDVEHYKKSNTEYMIKNASLKTKIVLYEKLLSKLFNERTEPTDEVFIFDGNAYIPIEFVLNRDYESADKLTVEFVKCDVDFLKKGEPA